MKIGEEKEFGIYKAEKQGEKYMQKNIYRSQYYNVKYRLYQQNGNNMQEKNHYK